MQIGYIGTNHHHVDPYLESIDQLPADVTAVADPVDNMAEATDDRFASATGYKTPTTLLDKSSVDLIWITASNRNTPGLIRAALDHGIHVFTEKPAAKTAADLKPVAEAARRSDTIVGTAYTWRAHPIAEQLRKHVSQGFFGEQRSVAMRFFASDPTFRNTDHYLFDPKASRGGIVQWLGVHWLDLLPWLLDDPIVVVNASFSESDSYDVEIGATIQFQTQSGTIGSLDCGYYLADGRYDTEIAINGRDGYSRWDPMGETFGFDGTTSLELDALGSQWKSTPHRQVVHEYQPASGYGGKWGLTFFEEFIEACNGTTEPPADLDDAMTVLRILDAIYESARRDEWVSVERENQ